MLHSLVRVSRRVGCSHLSTNGPSARRGRPPDRAGVPSADTARSPHRGTQTDRGGPAPEGLRCTRESSRLSSVAPRPPDGRLYVPYTSAGAPPDRPSGPEATAVGRLPTGVQSCRAEHAGRGFAETNVVLRRPLNLIRSHFSCIRFPPNGFAVFLTLFSKYFSPFPHGTCSLSVSCRYLALDGVYHPLWAAFPNNPTLGRRKRPFPSVSRTGLSPSPTCLSRSTSTATVGAMPPLPATILWQHLPGISGSSCSRFARRYWGNPC